VRWAGHRRGRASREGGRAWPVRRKFFGELLVLEAWAGEDA
jgi:hypothetical protein